MPRNYSDTSIPLIPVLWNRAWIVLGHNMELQNPASSFKDHHLFYIRNMWLLNRQLIPSTDTRFCLPHLLSHSSITAAQKPVTKTSVAHASIWVSKSLPFRGGTGVCRPIEVWHFSPMSSLCYTQEKERSLCPRQKWLKNGWKMMIYSSEIWLYFFLLLN